MVRLEVGLCVGDVTVNERGDCVRQWRSRVHTQRDCLKSLFCSVN